MCQLHDWRGQVFAGLVRVKGLVGCDVGDLAASLVPAFVRCSSHAAAAPPAASHPVTLHGEEKEAAGDSDRRHDASPFPGTTVRGLVRNDADADADMHIPSLSVLGRADAEALEDL